MQLHIGGKSPHPDWKLMNIQPGPGVDYVGDMSNLTQFANSSVSAIYASHVLEHIPQPKMFSTLEGIYRILSPGGKFYISVPDMDVLCHLFISPSLLPKEKFHVMRMIFGGQIDCNDYHFFGWNINFLTSYLSKVGFSKFDKVESFGLFHDTSEYESYGQKISLNLIATK